MGWSPESRCGWLLSGGVAVAVVQPRPESRHLGLSGVALPAGFFESMSGFFESVSGFFVIGQPEAGLGVAEAQAARLGMQVESEGAAVSAEAVIVGRCR